ncbi:MAG: CARDB domain-containing protein [Anaerolineae bacterium]|nr:right-handed parallel beta-helix repeat-containing protein [Thermoflexales bacterium]MDW8408080.1 CARDB domain-containing protein [Anaerolineae bacterium]
MSVAWSSRDSSSLHAAPGASPNLAFYWLYYSARVGEGIPTEVTAYFAATDLNAAQLTALQVAAYRGDPAAGGVQIASTNVFTRTEADNYFTQLSWTPNATGVFSLYVVLDPDNLIAEANENDNRWAGTIEVVPPRSELTVFTAEYRSNPLAIGLPVERSYWVFNSGDVAAQNVSLNVYWGDPRNSGQFIGASSVTPSLAAKTSTPVTVVITPTQLGVQQLYAWVDPADSIPEYFEDNNLHVQTITVREGYLTWYVDDSVNASGDGRSPTTAFKTITEALAVAANSDTISVAPGRYKGGIHVPAGVFLKGAGRDESFIDSVPTSYATVQLDKDSRIEGFTVAGGEPINSFQFQGIVSGERSVIRNNRVHNHDMGISVECQAVWHGPPCSVRTLIEGNIVDGNRFVGIWVHVGAATHIRNNTIANNAHGIGDSYGSRVLIENNLIVNNQLAISAPPSSTVQYNLVYPAPQWHSPHLTGTGMLLMDPLLRNVTAGDYRLQAGSPARKRGNPPGTDIGALPFVASGTAPAGLTINPQPDGTWLAVWQGNGSAGYALYVGEQSGLYTRRIDTGLSTTYVLSGVLGGKPNFIAVSAYNSSGDESDLSAEQNFTAPPLSNGIYQEDHPQLRYRGSWQRVSDARASGGSYMSASSAGDKLEFVFTGDQVVIYRRIAPDLGEANIMIDGVNLGTMTFAGALERWQVPAIFDRLGPGQHHLVLTLSSWPGVKPIHIDSIEIPGAFMPAEHQAQAVARVNYFRDLAGLPKAFGAAAIHQAAQAHAEFVANHQNDPRMAGLGFHRQHPDLSGYTGMWPSDRARYFGYTGYVGEDGHFIGDPVGSVDGWMETVYHRTLILCYSCIDVGYGRVNDGRGRFDVLNMGSRSGLWPDKVLPSTRRTIVYPAQGQVNVPEAWSGAEIPDPLPGLPRPVGYPISLQIVQPWSTQIVQAAVELPELRPGPGWLQQSVEPGAVSSWKLTLAELRNSRQESVPAYVLDVNSDPPKYLGPDTVFIISKAPLQKGETYIVRFVGVDSRGQPFDVRSAFSTGDRLAVANLTVSAVRATPLTPQAGQRVDYEIEVRNSDVEARDIVITIALPSQVTYVKGSGSSSAGIVSGEGPLTVTLNALPANQTLLIRYAATVGETMTQPAVLKTALKVHWDAGTKNTESVVIANGKTISLPLLTRR